MPATVISGKVLSQELRNALAGPIAALAAQGIRPGLTVILVGEDPASVSYVTGKEKDAREVGLNSETIRLPVSTSEEELLAFRNFGKTSLAEIQEKLTEFGLSLRASPAGTADSVAGNGSGS